VKSPRPGPAAQLSKMGCETEETNNWHRD
jgi:hypothetical protein